MLHSRSHFLTVAVHSMAFGLLFASNANAFAAAGVDADLPEIRAAAEKGSIHEEIALGAAYFSGRGVHQDLKLAAYWYEKAAGSGDPMAQNEIGYLYQAGLGVSVNEARAAHWFQLASAGGYLDAKVNLGVAYMWGAGVPRNPRLAEQLIREAADKGSPVGAAYLGDMYYFGVCVPEDKAAAEPWYEKGARLHNSLAAFRMGTILSRPIDHPRDIQRSVVLLRESASAGFVPAMHSLALIIVNHPELHLSSDEALALLNEAAEAGTWRSSVVLGILSRDGKILPKDDRAAYFHFQVAAHQGDETAKALVRSDLQVLGKRLDAGQKAKVDEEVNAWIEKHKLALEVIYRNSDHLTQFPAFALAATSPDAHAATLIPTKPL